jgi:hypothetical protein
MNEKIFDSYEEAHKYSLTIPWKVEPCFSGETCWCRVILPIHTIKYKRIRDYDKTEVVEEYEWIVPDGSIDKKTAEYIVQVHHDRLIRNQPMFVVKE